MVHVTEVEPYKQLVVLLHLKALAKAAFAAAAAAAEIWSQCSEETTET